MTIAEQYFKRMEVLRTQMQSEATDCFLLQGEHYTKFEDGSVLVEWGETFTMGRDRWLEIEEQATSCKR
jgi:hypothetical protein